MWRLVVTFLFFGTVENALEGDFLGDNMIKIEHYVYWPNGTIPFYIDPEHFDHEQSKTILLALTNFAFKTCLKFLPTLVKPTGDQHVLLLQNPKGVRQCEISSTGHARDEPHTMVLGYDCLTSPKIDMMLMKALGFGFEHNRAIRDHYVSVQKENIEPSAIELFSMDDKLPLELRALPYDVNSVTHFDERDYSKNGHRTIIILDHKVKQNRVGLSDIDVRKINIVYGPECRERDRQEKIDLCQGFPGVARRKRSLDQTVRRKRDIDPTEIKSLRVNPDITPPPEVLISSTNDLHSVIGELGIKDGVEEITERIFKLGALALNNTRNKYCNNTDNTTEVTVPKLVRQTNDNKPNLVSVVENIAGFVKDMVDHALSNLTAFCESDNNSKAYQRACPYYSQTGGGGTCWGNYRSTNIGPPRYSTKNRPYLATSTKGYGGQGKLVLYDSRKNYESGRKAEVKQDAEVRRKRETNDAGREPRSFKIRRYNVRKHLDDLGRWDDSGLSAETKRKRKLAAENEKSFVRHDGPNEERNREERSKNKKADSKASKGVPRTVKLSKENKEFYGERKWPDGVVRYIIANDPSFDLADLRRRLNEVNRILKERTCVKLEEITEEDTERFEDYLVLDASADYITGRVGGRQNFGSLELFEGGQHKQHTAMMVMAMLGFYFELARHDRDAHVRVHMRHVRADKLHHFEKIRSDATLPLPYDYESATHPAWQFWRNLGRSGISTVATYKEKDPDGSIMRSLGQHDQLLSELDIVKINSVYGVRCFKKPKKSEDREEQEEVVLKYEYTGGYSDKESENGELERHMDDDKYKKKVDKELDEEEMDKSKDDRYITKDESNVRQRHKIRDDNDWRQRDRHRNKHEFDKDDATDKDDRDMNKENDWKIQRESDEDRKEMDRLGNKEKGNREEVDKQSRDRFEYLGTRLPKKSRIEWAETEEDIDRHKKKSGYEDSEERYRGKGRPKNTDEMKMETHEKHDNKYHDKREHAAKGYIIKSLKDRQRNKERERRERDRQIIEENRAKQRYRMKHTEYKRDGVRGSRRNKSHGRRDGGLPERPQLTSDLKRHHESTDGEREKDGELKGRPDEGLSKERDSKESNGAQVSRELGRSNQTHVIFSESERSHTGHLISNDLKDGFNERQAKNRELEVLDGGHSKNRESNETSNAYSLDKGSKERQPKDSKEGSNERYLKNRGSNERFSKRLTKGREMKNSNEEHRKVSELSEKTHGDHAKDREKEGNLKYIELKEGLKVRETKDSKADMETRKKGSDIKWKAEENEARSTNRSVVSRPRTRLE